MKYVVDFLKSLSYTIGKPTIKQTFIELNIINTIWRNQNNYFKID